MGGGEKEKEREGHASTLNGRKRDEAEEVDEKTLAPKHSCLSHDPPPPPCFLLSVRFWRIGPVDR